MSRDATNATNSLKKIEEQNEEIRRLTAKLLELQQNRAGEVGGREYSDKASSPPLKFGETYIPIKDATGCIAKLRKDDPDGGGRLREKPSGGGWAVVLGVFITVLIFFGMVLLASLR